MKKIISTVGTSIFENFFQTDGKNSNHNGISEYKQLKKDDLSYPQWGQQKLRIETLRKALAKSVQGPCAEISSILAIQKELREKVTVHLLATDTILSVLAAELIKEWFEKEENKGKYPGISVVHFERTEPSFDKQADSKHVIRKLRIDRQSNFEEGIMNLLEVLNEVCTKESILNITGGYKGMIPIVTIWAQIKKVPLKYLFRESELDSEIQPLTLERLPIHFDWEFIETVAYALNEDVRMNLKDDHDRDKELLELLIKNQLLTRDRNLTALGTIFQQYINQNGQPTSNSILGLFVEYKLFEFFSTSSYLGINYQATKMSILRNPDGMLTDQRTEFNRHNGYCEIDLFLNAPDDAFVIAEVKAYNQVGDQTFEELFAKSKKYVEFKPGQQPAELWLIVVSASLKTSIGEWYSNKKDPKYKVIQKRKAEHGTMLRVFSYQFDLSVGKLSQGIAAINTKLLLQDSIQEHELVEIDLSNG